MTDHAEYRELSAGYVLGALDGEDRRRFEGHLGDCDPCRRDVASFAAIPGLLSRAGAFEDVRVPEAVIDAAVARTVSEWRALHRSRRLWRGLAAVAALIIVVIAAIGLLSGPESSVGDRLAISSEFVTGEVSIDARRWGTAVHLDLQGLPARDHYVAWVVDGEGNRHQAATWGPTPSGIAILNGASSIPADRVVAVFVTSSDPSEALLTARAG